MSKNIPVMTFKLPGGEKEFKNKLKWFEKLGDGEPVPVHNLDTGEVTYFSSTGKKPEKVDTSILTKDQISTLDGIKKRMK